MGESGQSNPGRVLRLGIPDILDELDRLLEMRAVDAPAWVEWGRGVRAGLAGAYRRQLEVLEALEVILDLLGVDPENRVHSGGMVCLLGPLVEKLGAACGGITASLNATAG
ncbi:hypothetical protein [Pelomonas sp. BJYL3]|uniref:hypothetical protein n=1 Tax=Pelomonas sp. BJYL3 TaxID=2976697 RepID=UPI0022B41C65|nr:hypothetical protein [Pelomonas sp. BJYL3]